MNREIYNEAIQCNSETELYEYASSLSDLGGNRLIIISEHLIRFLKSPSVIGY